MTALRPLPVTQAVSLVPYRTQSQPQGMSLIILMDLNGVGEVTPDLIRPPVLGIHMKRMMKRLLKRIIMLMTKKLKMRLRKQLKIQTMKAILKRTMKRMMTKWMLPWPS